MYLDFYFSHHKAFICVAGIRQLGLHKHKGGLCARSILVRAKIPRVAWFDLDVLFAMTVAANVLAAIDRVCHVDISFCFVKFLEFEEILCTRLGLDVDFSIVPMLLERSLAFRFHQREFESTETTHDYVEEMMIL